MNTSWMQEENVKELKEKGHTMIITEKGKQIDINLTPDAKNVI